MKKQFLFLLLPTLIFASCSKSNDSISSVEPEKKLTKIEGIITPYKFGQANSEGKYRWSLNEYNQDGNLTSSSTRTGLNDLDATKSYDGVTTYKYENKRLIEKKDLYYRYTYTYNGADTTEIKKYGSLGLYETQKIEYGTNSKKISIYTAPDNSLLQIQVFKYDSNNNNTTIDIFSKPFISSNQLIYTYDNKGNFLTESYFNTTKNTTNLQKRAGYVYDEKGRILEYTKSIYSVITFRKFKNTYDDKGLLIKQELFESNNFDGTYEQKGTINYTYTYQ